MSKNKGKWVSNFMDLDPDYQLEIARAIVEELSLNEETFEEDEKEDYDSDESKIVRKAMERFIESSPKNSDLRKVRQTIQRFDALPEKRKAVVFRRILKEMDTQIGLQQQEDLETVCIQKGHTFGRWKYNEWTTYEDVVIDHQAVPNFPCSHENWERVCSRCGFVQKVDEEPETVKTYRLKKEKDQRIRSLEAELRRLKGEK